MNKDLEALIDSAMNKEKELATLALKGSAWAKVLGVFEIVLGIIFVLAMMIMLSV